jgi:hypothetical protein
VGANRTRPNDRSAGSNQSGEGPGSERQNASAHATCDQDRSNIGEIAWQLAQQCRSIVQACLREEEWQDADREFCDVIRQGITEWWK